MMPSRYSTATLAKKIEKWTELRLKSLYRTSSSNGGRRNFMLFRKKYNADFFVPIDNYISQCLLHTENDSNVPFSYSKERKQFLEEDFNKKLENWKRISFSGDINFIFEQIETLKKLDPLFYEELFLFYEQIKYNTSSSRYKREVQRIKEINDYDRKNKGSFRYCISITSPSPESKVYDILDSILSEKEKSFAELLSSILERKGLKESAVYKSVSMSRKVFSKISNGQHPSKDSAIMLAFGLQLNIKETQEFLNAAGYCLSHSIIRDLILIYCIENSKNTIETDIFLAHYGEPLLFSIK